MSKPSQRKRPMASGRMSTPWMLISRSPLALSMRMSVLAPGQPTAVRTSLRGGRLTRSRSGRGRARRWRWSLEDPAVDLEHLGELAADVDAAREGDVADVVLARVVAVALAGVAGQGLHLLLDVALLEPHAVSYTHLRAHETVLDLVCRLLLE